MLLALSFFTITLAFHTARAADPGIESHATDTTPITTSLITTSPPTISSDQCLHCHATESTLSHPVSALPPATMKLPAAFPLQDGRVTCITCHLNSFDAHTTNTTNPSLLRGKEFDGPAFCAQCHTTVETTRQAQHPFALSRAHLAWSKSTSTIKSNPLPENDGIRNCLSCHDGTLASDSFGNILATPGKTAAITGQNHPVGIRYTSTAPSTSSERALRPLATLDHRIRLTDNQVTCNSCHSLYSRDPKLLTVSMRESNLCTSCHMQ